MENTNLLNELWEYAEEQNTTKQKRLYSFLNKDLLDNIVLDNGVFWFEGYHLDEMPNYIYDIIVNHFEKQGYKYLYHISTNI